MRLVYVSPVPWRSYTQRPHAFVTWFHERHGGPVLWIDPYPSRLPSPADLARDSTAAGSTGEAPPDWLTVVRPRALPVEPLPVIDQFNRLLWRPVMERTAEFTAGRETVFAVGKPCALAVRLMHSGGFAHTLYDAMDDFPAFYRGLSRRAIARHEHAIASDVGHVLVSSTALMNRWRPVRPVRLVHNACAEWLALRAGARLREHAPVLGYVGTIGKWFDWDLVGALARAMPAARIELVGPVHAPPPLPLPGNVRLEPPVRHEAAIAAMQRFSCGLIPFVRSRLTDAVDPVKYYEYRACGLPVIASAFGEMRFRGGAAGVFLVEPGVEGDALAALVATALEHLDGDGERLEFIHANTWRSRFDAVAPFG